MLMYADACGRMRTYADVCCRMLTVALLLTGRKLWTDYLYLEADEGSRPASALVSLS